LQQQQRPVLVHLLSVEYRIRLPVPRLRLPGSLQVVPLILMALLVLAPDLPYFKSSS
jgi:hypothetical protein